MPRNSRVSPLLGVLLSFTLFSPDGTQAVSPDRLLANADFGLLFDGLDDRLQLGGLDLDADASGGAGLTLEVRFRAEDLCRLGGCDARLVSKAAGLAEQDHYWMLGTFRVGADVRLRFRLKANGITTTLVAASGNLTPGRQYHAAATYDGARMRLYLDGVEVASAAKSGPVSANPEVAVWVGDNPPAAGSRPFAGLIDEVRVWSRARSAVEIRESRNRRLAGNERGLTAYLPLDEGMGQTARDQTPKRHHGSLGSTLGSDANDPAWFLVDDLPDIVPPTVRLTKPVDREVVSGTIMVAAEAEDDQNVDHVEFLLDGVALGPRQDRPPYMVGWNAGGASDGAHSLSAVATDSSGNSADHTLSVTVANRTGRGAGHPVGSPRGAAVALVAAAAVPSTRYVRSGATGSNSGLDWANAHPQLPPTLVRGDVYYIADGSYPGYTFDDPTSGSQYVTIRKATLSDHGTESGWQAIYGDGAAEFPFWDIQAPYVSIDGAVGQWAPDLPGFVPYGIRVRRLARGAQEKAIRVGRSGSPKDFIQIRHVEAQFTNTPRNSGSWYQGLDLLYGYGDHWTIEYSWLHDAGRVCFLPVGGDHHLVDHSVLERNGQAQVAERYNPSEHSEIMAAHPDTDFGTIRHSYVRDWRSTGGLMLFGNCDNWSFYGNVFATTGYWTPGVDLGNANGVMDALDDGQSSIVVYNNTFADIAYGGFVFISLDPSKVRVRNNIFDGVTNFPGLPVSIGGVRSHNWYRNVTGTFTEPGIEHGTSDPFADRARRNYRLKAATSAGDATIGATYAIDPDGVRRGDDGGWDRGAFEWPTGADTSPPVISAVASSSITSSGATIAWTTNEGSDSQVEYGTSTAYGSSTTLNPSLVTSHSQVVSGLGAGTLYHYRVKSKDAAGNLATSADFTFTTAVAAGTLTGSRAAWTTTTNVTTVGTLDWAHWGHGGNLTMNRKKGVAQQISSYTRLGTVAPVAISYFHGNPSVQAVSWSDGTPTPTVSGTSGLAWIDTRNLSGDGFQLTVPADTTTRTLKVYAGNWCQRTKLQALLGDGSAPAFTDTSWDVPTPAWQTAVYTLSYAAASSGQTLTVKLTIDLNHCRTGDVGEVGLYAATLAGAVTAQAPAFSIAKPSGPTRRP